MAEPTTSLPSPPSGDYLQWVIRNPEQVAAFLSAVFAVSNLRATVDGGNPVAIRLGPNNAVLPLVSGLKLPTAIANSTATAASVSTQLNLLLAALRTSGQLPN